MVSREKIKFCCGLAIKNIMKESTTDVELFSRPFELGYLRDDDVKNCIQSEVIERIERNDFKELKIHKIGHVLVPKNDLCDFRKCAIIDIVDEIIYLTLVLIIARAIEQERINASKKRVFSYRYKSDISNGYLFHPDYHFTFFRTEVARKSKIGTNRIIVECDISNFYDRLNIHRIESTLLSFKNADDDIVNLINKLLLYWANRDSYGLPVGSNASRILAEASLVNVDRFLLSHNVDFCRFVDDYKIFAKDAEIAHKHLALLTHCLSREGLFVNTTKTRMKDISFLTTKEDELISSEPESGELNEINSAAISHESIRKTDKDSLPKIIRGYSGLIPTKFRELTHREREALKNEDLLEFIKGLKSQMLVEPDEVKRLIKMIVAQRCYDLIVEVSSILRKFPQFIPYFVNFVSKYKSEISGETIGNVIEDFSDLFLQNDVPEYILVYLVKLFKIDKNGKAKLFDAFRNLRRRSGDYIGRALLESFNGTLSRAEVIEIRESFVRSDSWEKRQILRLVQNTLPDGEKNAFFKDVSIHTTDLFTRFIISKDENHLRVTHFK